MGTVTTRIQTGVRGATGPAGPPGEAGAAGIGVIANDPGADANVFVAFADLASFGLVPTELQGVEMVVRGSIEAFGSGSARLDGISTAPGLSKEVSLTRQEGSTAVDVSYLDGNFDFTYTVLPSVGNPITAMAVGVTFTGSHTVNTDAVVIARTFTVPGA